MKTRLVACGMLAAGLALGACSGSTATPAATTQAASAPTTAATSAATAMTAASPAATAAATTAASAATKPATAASTTAAKSSGPLPVGQMAKIGDVEVTVTGARWGQGYPQTEGNKILLIEASVKYVGSDKYNLSSLLQTQFYGTDNRKADVTIATDAKGNLDGTLTPGQTQVGEVAFEVNPANGPFRFRFQKPFGDDLAEWTIPAPQ